MRFAAGFWVLLLASGARAAESDPPGTVSLSIEVGRTAPMTEEPGANILCDDPAVVAPEYAADGNAIVLRGLKPGTTLCGVWIGNQKPAGLYRVQVVPAPTPGPKADSGEPPPPTDAGEAPDGGSK